MGGRVEDGTCLICLGAFRTGYLPPSGQLILHSGPPNVVVFRALKPGRAHVTLFRGEPYHNPTATTFEVKVVRVGQV
jgi:hypothetical protein